MAVARGDPPAVARQRVRRALRALRRDQPDSPSQGDVARRLGWSLSKMQRIEGGEVGVSPSDLRALLECYGVTDPYEVERLTEGTRTSRRERYVTPPEYRKHLTPSMLRLIQFEKEAVDIRAYQPVAFPGVVQTPAVAEAMTARWSAESEARSVRYEVRMARRKWIIERADGPEYYLILDESVIKRRVGSAKITAEQLEDLVETARQPRIHVRMVPLAKGLESVAMGAFQIVSVAPEDSLLYIENYRHDSVEHDPGVVAEFRAAFETFWKISMTEAATLRALVAEAAALRYSLDQDF